MKSRGNLKIRNIDKTRDIYITIGCYRETERLDRMLAVYQKAMTLANDADQDENLAKEIVSLHDHKGNLTVLWRNKIRAQPLLGYVETAWRDEFECLIEHQYVYDF